MPRPTKKAAQGPAITSFFSQSRITDSSLPGKALGDNAPSTTSRAKRALFNSTVVEVPVIEVQKVTLPAETKVEPTSRRALFNTVPKKAVKVEYEVKQEPVKEEIKIDPIVSSIIPTEAQIAATETKSTKLRSVDLQAELAKKGADRIHEQAAARDNEKMAERVATLKSPMKMIQTRITGGSPPKRAKKESNKRGPVKVLPVPPYVLPSNSVEKGKERLEREKTEERETSPQEDSLKSAPKGYGSSLMNDEVKTARDVPLPADYSELYKTFNACETIVCLFDSSGKTLTFSALSKEVKKQTRKEFSFDRFAQILAVYPQAYNVQVKKLTCVGDRMGGVRTGQWEHVIKPNLDDDLISFVTDPSLLEEAHPSEPILTTSPRKNLFSPMKGRPITSSSGIRIPSSPRKPASPVKQIQREAVMDSRKRLKGWRKTCRQQVFRCLLARRVFTAYAGFVKDLNLPPSSPVPPIFFNREFAAKIDSYCVQIEKAMIEQIPEEENGAGPSHQGMSEFLKKASETVTSIPKGVEAALNELRSPEKKAFSARGVPLSPAKFAQAPKPMSLLEKIKAKAALKAAEEMKRNPELEEKMADLVRLVNDKILILIFDIYRSNSKTSIKLNEMEDRMVASGKISRDKIPSLLRRLTTLVPSCFSISKTSIGEFMKVTDNSTRTCEKVESALKQEMEACKKETTV